MTLQDYNELAYEFAIRNPKVIELLSLPLTDNTVQKLLTFGINATSVYIDGEIEIQTNSLEELYLDYEHLKIEHTPCSPYGEGQVQDENTHESIDTYRGDRILIHPNSKDFFYRINKEPEQEALNRIQSLIGTAKLNQLERVFRHYDAVMFYNETVYSLDTTTKTKKTINSDIKLVTEWIQPQMYLQLIPQHIK
jgi:hypothetical protein